MLLICTLSKLIVSTGLVTIILQVGVGVISYIGMLILLKENLNLDLQHNQYYII